MKKILFGMATLLIAAAFAACGATSGSNSGASPSAASPSASPKASVSSASPSAPAPTASTASASVTPSSAAPATAVSPKASGASPSASASTASASGGAGLVLKEENGVLTCVDTKNSPFAASGLHITVDKTAKTVKFVKTDTAGKDTVEYWKFNMANSTAEKFTYVSAMGTGFYYTYDLTKGELAKVEDDKHVDKTDSTKQAGRFDSTAQTVKDDVSKLTDYFKTQFGKSIADAAAGK